MINKLIDELVCYGLQTGLVDEIDAAYTKNKLLELFDEQFYAPSDFAGEPRPVNEILDDMMVIAHEKGIMEDDTITTKDLFDTKIMGLLTPPPSVVQ